MPSWALPALSWLISFYFLAGFSANVGFPPDRNLMSGDAVFVALWLFFLFLPFFSRIKIGNLLELERELERTKQELTSFKTEVRSSLSVLSTNVNTMGNMSNQVTVNIPGLDQLQDARASIASRTSPHTREEAEDVERGILLYSEDTTMALARTRIEIEGLLRSILGKRMSVRDARGKPIKFYGARQLFDMFVDENKDYEFLLKPFLYVSRVCNAAIHAQAVSEQQAEEALALGADIIAVLQEELERQQG